MYHTRTRVITVIFFPFYPSRKWQMSLLLCFIHFKFIRQKPGVQGLNISSILLFNVLYPCSSKIIEKKWKLLFLFIRKCQFPTQRQPSQFSSLSRNRSHSSLYYMKVWVKFKNEKYSIKNELYLIAQRWLRDAIFRDDSRGFGIGIFCLGRDRKIPSAISR